MIIRKLKDINIRMNGLLHLVFHDENDETQTYKQHVENTHIADTKIENHSFPKVAELYQLRNSYPGIDEEPTVSEIELKAGRVAAIEQQLNVEKAELFEMDGMVDGVKIK